MAEVKKEARTVLVHYECDVHGCPGEMKPTGKANTSMPMQYVHKCSVCGIEQKFTDMYPVMRVEPIDK
jgi:hypothetical protein